MRNIKVVICAVAFSGTLFMGNAYAGNEDRAGSSGGSELLINPWARSSGWGNSAGAYVTGIEATFLNVAGLAFTNQTEVMFTHTNWLSGTGINISALGIGQRIGESSVLGLSVMSMGFGDIDITTTELPEGGIGVFSPRYMNLGLAYAKEFSNSIYGGINVKVISESISNMKSSGVAFDAGIRYVTGETDNIKFGISLKNVGPPMSFGGDGLSTLVTQPSTGIQLTTEYRSAKFELPSLISISGSYDININEMHKVTLAGAFTSNSFTKDQWGLGFEYAFDANKAMVRVRGGYLYEDGIIKADERATALTGPAGGVTVEVPFGSNGASIGFDYSYRASNPFGGSHSIGARINIM